MTDPTATDVCAPPRQVFDWTVVAGHEVRLLRRAANGSTVGVCSCGERRSDVSKDWRVEHLGEAWPVLIPREPDESIEAWRERVAAALDLAREQDERLSADLDRRMSVKPGQPYPVITEEHVAASQRTEVLEHQLTGPPFRARS